MGMYSMINPTRYEIHV